MITLVKIFSIILGATVISKTYHDFKKGTESLLMFFFWTIAWIGIIILSLFPDIVDKMIVLSHGEKIGTGTFLGMSIIFLFFVIYRVYVKTDRVEKDLASVVRKLAIKLESEEDDK